MPIAPRDLGSVRDACARSSPHCGDWRACLRQLDARARFSRSLDRNALPVCGDRAEDRFTVMHMIDDLGFEAFDAGSLNGSWRQQIRQSACYTDVSVGQLRLLLERADPATVTKGHENAMSMMSTMPKNFPKADLVRATRFEAGIDRLRPATWVSLVHLLVAMIRRRD